MPVLGTALHGAKLTGYDQAGRLVPRLSGAEMKRKQMMEQEGQINEMGQEGVLSALAATSTHIETAVVAIQRAYRGFASRS